jgi:hypothetical protein
MNYDGVTIQFATELFGCAVSLLCLLLTVIVVLKVHHIRRQIRQDVLMLELTPPPSPHNTLQATEEFFKVLGHLVSMRSWRDLVSGRKATIGLEVVSTRNQGIRYLVRIPRYDALVFRQNLAALAPTVVAEEVADYITQLDDTKQRITRLFDLKQTGPRNYALKHSHQATTNDPIAYVANAITRLEEDELIALQLVLSPASDWSLHTDTGSGGPSVVPADIAAATIHKSHQPQFQASVRVLIQTTDKERNDQRVRGIRSALTAYSYEDYQALQPRLDIPGWIRRYRFYAFYHRLPALFSRYGCMLASSELAALYHFPYGTAVHTEDIRIGRPTLLPVPLAVKNQTDVDVLLGENSYRGQVVPIGLTANDRKRHMYVVGGTGNGKSTLLQHAIVQDIQAGKGVAVIDPHGDLAETILGYIPDDRIDEVVYFNPADISNPIGLNLLELTPGLTEDALLEEKDLVTESVVSMFRKIFSTSDTNGHRIEYVLRNAVQTALTLENSTLFTVYELLNNAEFRKRTVASLENQDLRLFWAEYNRAGTYQQVSMAAGITAKIGRFLFSASARRILEQPVSSFNFDDLMQEGKILICNVSKGRLGEDTSELFGIMVMAKLQLATMRRAMKEQKDRRPFYVYIDEFQNFVTPSFVQLLSEARKYGLFLTMAEQSTSQQSDRRMIDIVFANVGTIICFRTASQQDEQLLQPLLSPYVEQGTLSRLPAYHFYVRISAEQTQIPFSGRTVLPEKQGDEMLARMVIQASRMKYAKRTPMPVLEEVPAVEIVPNGVVSLRALLELIGGTT